MSTVRIPRRNLDGLKQPSRSITSGTPELSVVNVRAQGAVIWSRGLMPMFAGPTIRLSLDPQAAQQFIAYHRLLVRRTYWAIIAIVGAVGNIVLVLVPAGAASRDVVGGIKLATAITAMLVVVAMAALLATTFRIQGKLPVSYPMSEKDGTIRLEKLDPVVAQEWHELNRAKLSIS